MVTKKGPKKVPEKTPDVSEPPALVSMIIRSQIHPGGNLNRWLISKKPIKHRAGEGDLTCGTLLKAVRDIYQHTGWYFDPIIKSYHPDRARIDFSICIGGNASGMEPEWEYRHQTTGSGWYDLGEFGEKIRPPTLPRCGDPLIHNPPRRYLFNRNNPSAPPIENKEEAPFPFDGVPDHEVYKRRQKDLREHARKSLKRKREADPQDDQIRHRTFVPEERWEPTYASGSANDYHIPADASLDISLGLTGYTNAMAGPNDPALAYSYPDLEQGLSQSEPPDGLPLNLPFLGGHP